MITNRYCLMFTAAFYLLLTTPACVETNPTFCDDNTPCTGGLRCNLATLTCESQDGGTADIGGDTHTPDSSGDSISATKTNGQACNANGECLSGFCTDDVCCNSACDGTCESCNQSGSLGLCSAIASGTDPDNECAGTPSACSGQCNGARACSFPQSETSCGTTSCATGELTSQVCDGAGGCGPEMASCGGFACADATSCKTTCASGADCIGGAVCNAPNCTAALPLGSACGTNDQLCASGNCTDGVCCDTAECGPCKVCNANGQGCMNEPAGPAANPADCPGSTACGAGMCDGAGGCAYASSGTSCGQSCTGTTLTTQTCDGTGGCTAVNTECKPYRCAATGGVCATTCATSADCSGALNTLCDRTTAHSDGGGCIDGTSVQPHASGDIASAVNVATGNGMTHVLLTGTSYPALTVNDKTITIVGAATATIDGGSGTAVTVLGASPVALQNVRLISELGSLGNEKPGAIGLSCQLGGVTLVDSVVEQNGEVGIKSGACAMNIRRNVVRNNFAGVQITSSGQQNIINNLIVENGTEPPFAGGQSKGGGALYVGPSANPANVNIEHNTIANNYAETQAGVPVDNNHGVTCDKFPINVRDSIVYDSSSTGPAGHACVITTSAWNLATGSGNIAVSGCGFSFTDYKPTMGGCIDGAPSGQSLDLDSAPRPLGGGRDMGCYEVQ